MNRRLVLTALAGLPLWTRAHHGWSSFDQDRPLYLAGRVQRVSWRNPHAELVIERAGDLRLPADLPQRSLPAQAAPVDGKALLGRAVLPTRSDRQWEVELAPLTRMEAWKVEPLKAGATVEVLGFTFKDEKGQAILRAEYLWLEGGRCVGLRSSPA